MIKSITKSELKYLQERFSNCIKRKKELINYLDKLKKNYSNNKISYAKYVEIIHSKKGGKTIEEWIKFYHNEALHVQKKIRRVMLRDKTFKLMFFSAFIILIVFLSSILFEKPSMNLVGLITKTYENISNFNIKSFSQNINLKINETSTLTWAPENYGQLNSLKISGFIEGQGKVEVYLNELLILDSSKIKKTKSRSITGLASLAIESEKLQSNKSEKNLKESLHSLQNTKNNSKNSQKNSSLFEKTNENRTVFVKENVTEKINGTISESNKTFLNEKRNTSKNINSFHENSSSQRRFIKICEETCNLKKLNLTNKTYTLKVKISNAKIQINEITYEIIEKQKSLKLSGTNVATNETNITTNTIQHPAEINKPVKWTKKIKLDKKATISISLPKQAKNITAYKIIKEQRKITSIKKLNATKKEKIFLTGMAVSEPSKQKTTNLLKRIFSALTGKAVSENIEIVIKDNSTEYEIEYFTEAPQSHEEKTPSGKKIIISGPDDVHYTDVLAYTHLPEEAPESRVKLYHIVNNSKQEVQIKKYDLNNNSLIDYIEWNVPHLSNQTYELEITIINVQSYPTVGGNWSVEFNTTGTANLTITAINNTTWSNTDENKDLKFLEVKCGNQTLNYEWINNSQNSSSVFIKNYSCNQTAVEISKVLTTGGHYLEFNFGGIKAYAKNFASKNTSDSNLTIWDLSDNREVYANYSWFKANYSDLITGEPINGTGVFCEFRHNKTGIWKDLINMSYNSSTGLYELKADGKYIPGHREGMPVGNYSYNISCFDLNGNYNNISLTDRVIIKKYNSSLSVENISYSQPKIIKFTANFTSNGKKISQIIWQTSDLGAYHSAVKFIDNDGDGKRDEIAIAMNPKVYVFEPNGTLIWSYGNTSCYYGYKLNTLDIFDVDEDNIDSLIASGSLRGPMIVENGTEEFCIDSASGSEVITATIGDFDGDGKRDDFIVSNQTSLIAYFYNGSDWNQNWSINTGAVLDGESVITDLNEDGIDDLFILDDVLGLYGYYGNNGTLIWSKDVGSGQYSVSVGDFDHDGKKHEFVVTESGDLFWINSSGDVYQTSSAPALPYLYESRVLDVDNDGYEDDVVISDGYGSGYSYVRAFNESAAELWNYRINSTAYMHIYALWVGDVNADGDKEILVSDRQNKEIYVLNKTTGILIGTLQYNKDFVGSEWFGKKSESIQTGDINDDGISDIAVGSYDSYLNVLQNVFCKIQFNDSETVYDMIWNDSSQQWEVEKNFEMTERPYPTDAYYTYNVTCKKGGYLTQASDIYTLHIEQINSSLEAYDQEQDSEGKAGPGYSEDPSVLINENTFFWANYTNDTNSAITEETWDSLWTSEDLGTIQNSAIGMFDADSDGLKNDIVTGMVPNHYIKALYPNGSLRWVSENLNDGYGIYYSYSDIISGDLNGDGYEGEIVLAGGYYNAEGHIKIIDKNGQILSSIKPDVSGCDRVFATAIYDLNGDNYTDIVWACDNRIWAYTNNGTGYFSHYWNHTISNPTDIIFADADCDNNTEVVFTNGSGISAVELNGTPIWYALSGGGYTNNIAAGDFNGDGCYEFGVCYQNGYALINSSGVKYRTLTQGYNVNRDTAPIDINDDGIMDFVYIDMNEEIWACYDNGTCQWSYDAGTDSGNINIYDINNDNKEEIIIGGENGDIIVLNKEGNLIWEYSTGHGAIGYYTNEKYIVQGITFYDLENDNLPEIIVATRDGYIHAIENTKPHCKISFSDNETKHMSFNTTYDIYQYNRSFSSAGTYTWNISCDSRNVKKQTYLSNITINEGGDTTPPLIYLEYPANNTINTTDNTPDFIFNATDETASTLNCTLWLNNSAGTVASYGSNDSTLNATSTTITANSALSNGDYWWWINCSDGTNTNISEKRNISISFNQAPQITYISEIPNVNPIENAYTSVIFYVTMYDADGVDDLNDSSVKANFTKPNEISRKNLSCLWINDIDSKSANYSCTIDMWYFDGAGNWNISVYGKDNSGEIAFNDSTYFQYNLLQAITISPKNMNFNVSTNAFNQSADNNPMIINNTGNANLTNKIAINAINLLGETNPEEYLSVENISINVIDNCSGNRLINATDKNISNTILEKGNLSSGSGTAQEELYFCINEVGILSSQTYSTSQGGQWTIKILGVAIIAAKKRKKRKSRKSRSVLVVEDLSVPVKIFLKDLGGLESLVKFLKENLKIRYSEIAEILNRNQRTIWTAYSKSLKKHKQKIPLKAIEKSRAYIPVSIFKNRKLTIFEALVFYLKGRGLKYVEIAELLERDQRNIWTIHNRGLKNLKAKSSLRK